MSDIASANEAPVSARTSVSYWLSAEKTVAMICVSFWYPSGNSGRQLRSIRREISVSRSVRRPSRRKKLPGMRPAAERRSW